MKEVIHTPFDEVMSEFGRDMVRAKKEEKMEHKEEKREGTKEDLKEEKVEWKTEEEFKSGGVSDFTRDNMSDWTVDRDAGEPDSAEVTHRFEECGNIFEVCARRFEDLFIEVTSSEGSQRTGGDSKTGYSAHMSWKDGLVWRKWVESARGSSEESAAWSQSLDSRMAEGELDTQDEMSDCCSPVFGNSDDSGRSLPSHLAVPESKGPNTRLLPLKGNRPCSHVFGDSDDSCGSVPLHLDRPKSRMSKTRLKPEGGDLPKRAIDKDLMKNFGMPSRKEGKSPRRRGRSPGEAVKFAQEYTPLPPHRVISRRGEGFRMIESRESRRKRLSREERNVREKEISPVGTNDGAKPKFTARRTIGVRREERYERKRATSEEPSSCSMIHIEWVVRRSATPRLTKGTGRKPPKKWLAFRKGQEEKHEVVKKDARKIWDRLDHPTADIPSHPEYGMSDDAAIAAKRGRQCAFESYACGGNQTRRALRDHERSAKLKGQVHLEADRLREYPDARARYIALMAELRRRVSTHG